MVNVIYNIFLICLMSIFQICSSMHDRSIEGKKGEFKKHLMTTLFDLNISIKPLVSFWSNEMWYGEERVASSKSKGLSMHVAAVRGVFSPASARYFVNIFAPYPQPIAINVVQGLALLMYCIAAEISSLSAAVNNLHE